MPSRTVLWRKVYKIRDSGKLTRYQYRVSIGTLTTSRNTRDRKHVEMKRMFRENIFNRSMEILG